MTVCKELLVIHAIFALVQSLPTNTRNSDIKSNLNLSENETRLFNYQSLLQLPEESANREKKHELPAVEFVLKSSKGNQAQKGTERERYRISDNTLTISERLEKQENATDTVRNAIESTKIVKSNQKYNTTDNIVNDFVIIKTLEKQHYFLNPQESSVITEYRPSYIQDIFQPIFPEMIEENYRIKTNSYKKLNTFQSSMLEQGDKQTAEPAVVVPLDIKEDKKSQIQKPEVPINSHTSPKHIGINPPISSGPSLNPVPIYVREIDIPFYE